MKPYSPVLQIVINNTNEQGGQMKTPPFSADVTMVAMNNQ